MSTPQGLPKQEWIRFRSPSECRNYVAPEGLVLVGDSHIVRGNITVVAGPPGVGKSRTTSALAVAGATGKPWFGLEVHAKFKTLILQNENGRYRLAKEFSEISDDGLDEFIRISEPPPYGMAFDKPEFRADLERVFKEFRPAVVVLDPWNSVARDDKQRDYVETFESINSTLLKGDDAPALVIVAHTKKPQGDVLKTGRSLLNEVAGSHVLASVPRCVFVMQPVSDDTDDDRVIWTCAKNNDGEMGKPSVWHRRNGLFVPGNNSEIESIMGAKAKRTVEEADLEAIFEQGKRTLLRKEAVAELMKRTGCSQTLCYNSLMSKGKFAAHLREDADGFLSWVM